MSIVAPEHASRPEAGVRPLPDRAPTGPRLSVTVLNYNYGRYLTRCLDSIIAQTFYDFEVIILDDCSTDNSLEVVQPYLEDPRFRLVAHEKNVGCMDSLIEAGGVHPTGELISVISADDVVLSNRAFERQVELMTRDPATSFCYAAWSYLDAEDRHIADVQPWTEDHIWSGEDEFREFCTRYYVLHSGTIIRRSAYVAVGGFDPRMEYTHDNALWAVLCGVGSVAYVAEPLYGYRTHGANRSQSSAAVQRTIDEFLQLIDAGFAGLPDGPTKSDRRLYRRARQTALSSVATMKIFAGDPVGGWRSLAYAARKSPIEAIVQPRILSLLAASIVGPTRLRTARSLARRVVRRAR
jgi:glycosyltransferase involved in cell wall biosynthesis